MVLAEKRSHRSDVPLEGVGEVLWEGIEIVLEFDVVGVGAVFEGDPDEVLGDI